MIKVTAYRCQHCGKVYLKDYACKKHEEAICPKNPIIRPLCYSCEHYETSLEKEIVVWSMEDRYGRSEGWEKSFDLNGCKHPDNPCKLYNNVKLSNDMRKGLAAADFKAMPTRGTGGCPFYQAIPDHPYADKDE